MGICRLALRYWNSEELLFGIPLFGRFRPPSLNHSNLLHYIRPPQLESKIPNEQTLPFFLFFFFRFLLLSIPFPSRFFFRFTKIWPPQFSPEQVARSLPVVQKLLWCNKQSYKSKRLFKNSTLRWKESSTYLPRSRSCYARMLKCLPMASPVGSSLWKIRLETWRDSMSPVVPTQKYLKIMLTTYVHSGMTLIR